MSSATSRSETPERPDVGSAAEDTYAYGPIFRGSAYALLTSAVFLAVTTVWISFSGTGSSEWIPALGLLTLAVASGYQSAGKLLSTFRLAEDRLREERPLHADREIPFDAIRRLFIGGQAVEIYASPGSEPDLEFERRLRGGDELIEKLVRRLPPGAEIEHPSGELAERLGERAA